jgi:hypothetical protein
LAQAREKSVCASPASKILISGDNFFADRVLLVGRRGELSEGRGVKLESQTRPLRQGDFPINNLEFFLHKLSAQAGVRHWRGLEFHESAIRGNGRHMSSCSDADPRLPAMRDHNSATVQRHFDHTHRFGNAPDAADVGLHDVHASSVHELCKLESSLQPLAASDSDWVASDNLA